ncbi:MAG: hypothetical protein ABI789_13885 [Usitatibacter sp.]
MPGHKFSLSFLRYHVPRAALGLAGVCLVTAALSASGLVGHVALGPDEIKDPALVLSLVWHAALGIAIAFIQCAISITLGRMLFRRNDLPAAQALLLGLPASLAFATLGVGAVLVVPGGGWLFTSCVVLLLIPLRAELQAPGSARALLARVAATSVPAAVFGIWLGLLWHGPTATLAGWPSGDEVYYTTLVTTLASHPWPLRNWGNEGEAAALFNLLWPALGAALSKAIAVEPFAFITAAGGAAFIVGTTVALRAYVVARGAPLTGLAAGALVLGMLVAGRYPFWIVESPPMIHAVALTVAIWFWVSRSPGAPSMAIGATAASLVGAIATKVTTAVTLVPVAMSGMVPGLRSLSRHGRIAALVVGGVAIAAAGWMLWRYAPRLLAVGGVGPEGYVFAVAWGNGWASASTYVLRDVGTAVLALGIFFLVPWWTAAPIAVGLLGGLFIPFTLRAAFVSSVVLVTLAALDSPQRLARAGPLVLAGLLLCLPAMLYTDAAGWQTGVVWAACILAAARLVLPLHESVRPSPADSAATRSPHDGQFGGYATLAFALALVMFLVAVARGEIGMASNWLEGRQKLSPEVRALWRAVPEVVPDGALVFTDQTGPGRGLLEGWNTYAFHGQRQLFVSTWMQSDELQADLVARAAKLRWNERVLDGSLQPWAVPLRGTYKSFFAVVDRSRVPALGGWTVVRDLGQFAILRWDGHPATTLQPRP